MHLYSTFSISIFALYKILQGTFGQVALSNLQFLKQTNCATNLRILENRPEHKKNFNWKQVEGTIIKL